MQTPFDWLTLTVFAGLVVLLLSRSAEEQPRDKLWQYGPPAVGLAAVNYVGNQGHVAWAIAGLVAVLVYIFVVLKPSLHRP